MLHRCFIFLGGCLASVAVALDAIGAHALKGRLSEADMDIFRQAARYQMLHAIGLVLVGLLLAYRPSRWLALAGGLMLAGIVLFCGLLDFRLATGVRTLGFMVPWGGSAFILAWIALAIGGLGMRRG